MTKERRATRSLIRESRGAIYVEFLVTVVPFLLLFMGMTQMFLAFHARLLVKAAADAAVRSAIVVITDDGPATGDVNQLNTGGTSSFEVQTLLDMLFDQLKATIDQRSNQFNVGNIVDEMTALGDSRMNSVRVAAAKPLLALGRDDNGTDIKSAVGGNGVVGGLDNAVRDLLSRTAVTFRDGPGGAAQENVSVGMNDPVTVRVTFLFRCTVPWAKNILCSQYGQIIAKNPHIGADLNRAMLGRDTHGGWYLPIVAESTLTAQYADYTEL
ncbi:MAG: TadE/TadG family type IV pilus assembly protein [Polyangiales bacterium]